MERVNSGWCLRAQRRTAFHDTTRTWNATASEEAFARTTSHARHIAAQPFLRIPRRNLTLNPRYRQNPGRLMPYGRKLMSQKLPHYIAAGGIASPVSLPLGPPIQNGFRESVTPHPKYTPKTCDHRSPGNAFTNRTNCISLCTPPSEAHMLGGDQGGGRMSESNLNSPCCQHHGRAMPYGRKLTGQKLG